MTNKPTPTTADIQEACDRLNEFSRIRYWTPEDFQNNHVVWTASHLIAERNAERRRVSDVVKSFNARIASHGISGLRQDHWESLLSLILPDPEPTPVQVFPELIAEVADTIFYHVTDRGRRDKLAQLLTKIAKIKGGDDAG